MSSVSSSRPSSTNSSSVAGFGTNEWLVEEMYQQYLADPSSVDQAWHEFFADYRPGSPVASGLDREQPAPAPKAATPSSQGNGTPAAQPATATTAADSAGAQGSATARQVALWTWRAAPAGRILGIEQMPTWYFAMATWKDLDCKPCSATIATAPCGDGIAITSPIASA